MQVASAVHHVASVGCIHRAVSTSSFVVANNRRHIKLTDFSRARPIGADDQYEADGSEMVSVKWAAPEVLSQLLYSSRSDVWAVGVVLWQASRKQNMSRIGIRSCI